MSKPIALHNGMRNEKSHNDATGRLQGLMGIGRRTGLSRYICTASSIEWATSRYGNGRMARWEASHLTATAAWRLEHVAFLPSNDGYW